MKVVRVEPVALGRSSWSSWGIRGLRRFFGCFQVVNRLCIRSVGIVGRFQTASIEDGLCAKEIIENLGDLDGAIDVRRVASLEECGREKAMIRVTMSDEDVLRPLLIDA